MKTVNTFQRLKNNNEKITMLTAYDYSTAQVLEQAEIDGILVGDSLAMVALGYENTYNITIDEMTVFVKAVARGAKNSFIIGDMPFMSYNLSVEQGLENASKMIKAGASGVKLEGCNDHILTLIKRCVESGIPVLGHLGFTPQLMNTIGGHKIQGKTSEKIEEILVSAKKLEEAGCFAIVLELMPEESAKYITEHLTVPTIGIGAGRYCSGHVLVSDDMLGKFSDYKPKFVRQYANMKNVILDAVKNYCSDIKSGKYPSEEEVYFLTEDEALKLSKEEALC